MRKIKYVFTNTAVIFFLLLAFCVAGCGKIAAGLPNNTTDDTVRKSKNIYSGSLKQLPLKEDVINSSFSMNSQGCIYIKKTESVTALVWSDFDFTQEKTVYEIAENESILLSDITEEGSIAFIIRSDYSEGPEKFSLHVFNDMQGEILNCDLGDILIDDYPRAIDANGESFYLISVSGFVELDKQGKLVRRYKYRDDESNPSCIVRNSDIVLYGNNQRGFWYRIIDKKTFDERKTQFSSEARIWAGGTDKLYYYNGDGLVETSLTEDADVQLFSFSDVFIDPAAIKLFMNLSDGSFLFLEKTGEAINLIKVYINNDDNVKEDSRQNLNLICVNRTMFQGPINRFNINSDKYKVSILPQVSLDRYDAELLVKQYDLMEIPGSSVYEDYVRNGYIQDIGKFVEESTVVNQSTFFSRIFEDLSIDGKIYAFPREMGMINLWVPADTIGNMDSWNVNEFIDYLKSHPGAVSRSSHLSAADIKLQAVYYILLGIAEEITSDKDKIDETVLSYILEEINNIDIVRTSLEPDERLERGDAVLYKSDSITAADDLARVQSETGRKLVPIGFPSLGNSLSGGIIGYYNMLGISKNAGNSAAAWDCIEYVLAQKWAEGSWSVPTRIEDFNKRMKSNGFDEDVNINGIIYHPISDADCDTVKTAYERCRNYTDLEMNFVEIVLEEAKYYFSSEKSLDDVMNVITSRLNLMLAEGN